MNKPVTQVVLEAGLIDEGTVQQLRRWGLLHTEAEAQNITDPDEIVNSIREAMEGGELVELRTTDLDLIQHYLKHREKGKLNVPNPEDEARMVGLPVEYCVTKMGDYVIPWTSEGIQDLLLHEKTFLRTASGTKVPFTHVRELYYDRRKAFVVCTPKES